MITGEFVLFLDPKGTVFEVIKAAKLRGYKTVALTTYPTFITNPPDAYTASAKCLDYYKTIANWDNTSEVFSTIEVLKRKYGKLVGVYSGIDPAAKICAEIRLRCGFPTTSPETIDLILDKYLLRRKLVEYGLSTLKVYSSQNLKTWEDWNLGAPGYFKPTHGTLSAYVRRCTTFEDFQKAHSNWEIGNDEDPDYLKKYVKSGTSGGFIVEEELEGELLSVEGISEKGKFHCVGLLSRILNSKNPVIEMGSCFPYHPFFHREVIELVEKAHRLLEITDGPTHTEVIIGKNGIIEIIDLNPRFVGADVLQSINYAYEIRFEETLLDFAIGNPIHLELNRKRFACLQYFLAPPIPIFESATLPLSPDVPFKTLFVRPGSHLKAHNRQIDYIGCYLTLGSTFSDAINKSAKYRSNVKINVNFEGEF